MLEVKNVLDMETIKNNTEEKISQLQSQINEAENELKLLDSMRRSSKWFEELLTTLKELENNSDNIDILKKTIRQTHSMYYDQINALIGFEEGWLTTIEIQILNIRGHVVPKVFHEYSPHRNWYDDIYALKDNYPTAYISDSKTKKISLIGKAIESIGAWCLHRLYVLDENPRFGR